MATPNVSPIERAFQLALTGRCSTTADIISQLKNEGYSADTIMGKTLFRQLREAIDSTARGRRRDD